MKKLLQSLFVVLLFAASAMAQQRTITGTVTAKDDGLPLPGVTVRIKGSNVGTSAGADGKFSIKVSATAKELEFASVGYITQTRTIGVSNMINVLMIADAKQLGEVVVVAYGTAKKGSITGSVAQLNSKDLQQRPITNINNALAGVAPGIQTNAGSGQPGSGPSVRIRGFGSISSSNDPLYVVDGVPYEGDISNINVNDIENISLLKDASASALYGARAANGVIIVTTKKGKKGNEQLNVSVTQGLSSRGIDEYERVNAQQYYPLAWQAYRNSLVYPRTGTPLTMDAANTRATANIKTILGYNPFNVPNNQIVGTDGKLNPNAQLLYDDFDWVAPLRRVGQRGDYNMSYSGGTEKSDFFASLGYLNDKGYLLKSDYNRITGRVNINSQVKEWFKTGLNISGTMTKSNQASTVSITTPTASNNTAYVNPFFFARGIGPIYPVYAHDPVTGAFLYDANGDKIFDGGNNTVPGLARPSGAYAGRHTVQENLLNDNLFKRNALSARTYGEVKFLKDFKFTTNLSVDVSNYIASQYQNKIIGDGAPAGTEAKINSTTTSYNINQLLNYTKSFNGHNFDVLVGHENYNYLYNQISANRNTQVIDGNTELDNFTTTAGLGGYAHNYRVEGYFSRINYDYNSKYFFSASFRRDGSSKFSPENRWGNFYSVGGSWSLDKEDFLKSSEWISTLKLRASYGSVGNDKLLDAAGNPIYYGYQLLYDLNYNNASEAGVLQAQELTKDLKWESNKTADIGVEFGLFQNRLTGSVEFFNRKSDNLLFGVPLPMSSGLNRIYRNIGSMGNKGIEIQLAGDIVRGKDFTWNANVNWTLFRNKITKMPDDNPTIISGTKQLAVGKDLYAYWLRQWYGVDPTDGAALYYATDAATTEIRTINGQKLTTNSNNAKFDYSGSAVPKFYGAITNTFTYKDLSFSFLINYQVGGKFYDSNYQTLMGSGSDGAAMHVDLLNAWHQPGDNASIPRLDRTSSSFYNATSSRWLVDASYINLRSASLSYNLPKSWLEKVTVKNARVFVSGENLFLKSKRTGLNPSESFTGVNSNSYVPTRIVSLGLNVTL